VHAYIREYVRDVYGQEAAGRTRIQYGGSVKGDNARSLMEQPDIDGALVGGASLEAKSFAEIVKAAVRVAAAPVAASGDGPFIEGVME
jgi:triosephosphate isomerase